MGTIKVVCTACQGSGYVPDPNNPGAVIACPQCSGTGTVTETVDV